MLERRKNRYMVLVSAVIFLLLIVVLCVRMCDGNVRDGEMETVGEDERVEVVAEVTEEGRTEAVEGAETEAEVEAERKRQAMGLSAAKDSSVLDSEMYVADEKVEEAAVVEEDKEMEEVVVEAVIEYVVEEAAEIAVEEEKFVEKEIIIEEKAEEIVETGRDERSEHSFRAVMALKTNLLWDLALAPNIEIEFPFAGDRMSVMAEWWCPWWVTRNNSWCYQMLYGGLEARVWLGDRTKRPSLTGHFFGAYGGGGVFDFEWNNKGYQSRLFYTAGLTYGYSFPIHKNLRIETSVSLGYLDAKYSYYEAMENGEYLVWMYDGHFRWFGPTKAKVSLVWTILNTSRTYSVKHKVREGRR